MESKIKKTIKDLPKIERPREKLIRYGTSRLSNSELLAIILRSGKKGENVIDLANKILKKYRTENLPNLAYQELKEFSGLGPANACEIIACFELGNKYSFLLRKFRRDMAFVDDLRRKLEYK